MSKLGSPFVPVRALGTGSTATILECLYRDSGTRVAVKLFEEDDPLIAEECQFLLESAHPFIVSYLGRTNMLECPGIVLELCQGPTLLELVNAQLGLAQKIVQSIFCQLALVTSHLHDEAKVVHRDIKLENIIVGPGNCIKLIDFGLACRNEGVMDLVCGSLPYCAPEMVKQCPYTSAVDVWALGVCLYGMTTGCLPFDDVNTKRLKEKILYGQLEFPEEAEVSEVLGDLLGRMLEKDPEKRTTMKEVMQHPFIDQEEMGRWRGLCDTIARKKLVCRVSCREDMNTKILESMCDMGLEEEEVVKAVLDPTAETEIPFVYRMTVCEKASMVVEKQIVGAKNPEERKQAKVQAVIFSGRSPLKSLVRVPAVRRSAASVLKVPPILGTDFMRKSLRR